MSRSTPKKPDLVRAERMYREFMCALGLDGYGAHSFETPRRIAETVLELTAGLREDLDFPFTTFPESRVDELIVVKDIAFASFCEHHHLPFYGKAAVGYLPRKRIVGLSKIPRLVDHFSRRPQVQERLTVEIADAMMALLRPRAVLVLIEAEHSCISYRGVKKPGHTTVTSALRGPLSHQLKGEFLSLVQRMR